MSESPYAAAIRDIDMPARIRQLPIDPAKKLPVPWFVAWVDGKPFFPAIEHTAIKDALRYGRCWVCGQPLGTYRASVIGVMCAVNRVISEPQSHVDCAIFSARACPFLARPNMRRVPLSLFPAGRIAPAGGHSERNPGVVAVWIEKKPTTPFKVGDGVLFDLGEPVDVHWFTRGEPASQREIMAAVTDSLPALRGACDQERPHSRAAAHDALTKAIQVLTKMVKETVA